MEAGKGEVVTVGHVSEHMLPGEMAATCVTLKVGVLGGLCCLMEAQF